jgi:hypothetical protein
MQPKRNTTSEALRSAISSHKHFKIGAAIAIMALMVTLAFAPVVEPVQATDWAVVAVAAAANAGGWAIVGSSVADGLGALVGAGVGAMIVLIPAWLASKNANSALLDNAKNVLALDIINNTANSLAWARTNAINSLTLYNTSLYYFVRCAESAAQSLYDYQKAHSLPHTYDAEYVLEHSNVANGTMAYQWSIMENYNTIFAALSQESQSFVGTYDQMAWGVYMHNGAPSHDVMTTSSATFEPYATDLFSMMLGAGQNQKYIFSAGAPIYIVNDANTATSADLTLKYANGTIAYEHTYAIDAARMTTDSLGAHGLLSGTYYYTLNGTGGNALGFSNVAAPPSGGATVYPALISVYDNGSQTGIDGVWFRTTTVEYIPADGTTYTDGSPSVAPSIYVSTPNYRPTISIAHVWTEIMAIRSRTSTTISTVNSFAQSYYAALVLNNGGVTPVPDMVFPDPSQMANWSWEQIYSIYIAYCRALQPWFYNNSHMTITNISISNQSLKLVCRGAIESATGENLGDNTTVFTPFISLTNVTLTTGQWNTYTNPGFILVWGNATSLENNVTSTGAIAQNLTNPIVKYIPMHAGDKIWPVEMYYDGTNVSTVDLNITTLNFIVTPVSKPIVGAQAESDWQWLLDHWYLFAAIAGVIFLAAAIGTRRWEIAVIGLVLIAVAIGAYYLSGGLTGDIWKALGFGLKPGG